MVAKYMKKHHLLMMLVLFVFGSGNCQGIVQPIGVDRDLCYSHIREGLFYQSLAKDMKRSNKYRYMLYGLGTSVLAMSAYHMHAGRHQDQRHSAHVDLDVNGQQLINNQPQRHVNNVHDRDENGNYTDRARILCRNGLSKGARFVWFSSKAAVAMWAGSCITSYVRSVLPNVSGTINKVMSTHNIDWFLENYSGFKYVSDQAPLKNKSDDPFVQFGLYMYMNFYGSAKHSVNAFTLFHSDVKNYVNQDCPYKDNQYESLQLSCAYIVHEIEKINAYIQYKMNELRLNCHTRSKVMIFQELHCTHYKRIKSQLISIADTLCALVKDMKDAYKNSSDTTRIQKQCYDIQADIYKQIDSCRYIERQCAI
jgi:hypothetical protein